MVWILQNHYSLHLYVKKNVSLLVHILKGEGHLDWNGIYREDVRDGTVVHTAPSKSSKSRRPKAPKFQRQKTLWPHIIIKIISPSLNLRIGLGSAMEMIIMMMSVGSRAHTYIHVKSLKKMLLKNLSGIMGMGNNHAASKIN